MPKRKLTRVAIKFLDRRMAMAEGNLWKTVYNSITQSRPLTLTTFAYPTNERVHIDTILGAFLDVSEMAELTNNLSYCIHELAGNAKRANIKRLYFQEQNLDIFDETDYFRGMESFKSSIVTQIDHYEAKLKENGLYVKFQFRRQRNGIQINIRNNSLPTPRELQRVKEKLAIANSHGTLVEAFSSTADELEGAGLGIVMMVFMLRSMGFSQRVFSLGVSGAETIATLTLIRPDESGTYDMAATAPA
jgi:hypothetical protein